MKSLLALGACLALVVACSPGSERIVVAAGTTLVDSGFIDEVVEVFEAEHPQFEVSVVAQPTRLALGLGRQGAADLLLTHAPEQEAEFVADGYASHSAEVVESRFVVVGPAAVAPPPGLAAAEIFSMVASESLVFVSRGDGSGTHDAELAIWRAAGVDPHGEKWYLETGQGMGPTLLVADQRIAVALAELGAYEAARGEIDLVDYGAVSEGLTNVYTGHVVADSENHDGAEILLDWLVSEHGRQVMEDVNQRLFSKILYAPVGN